MKGTLSIALLLTLSILSTPVFGKSPGEYPGPNDLLQFQIGPAPEGFTSLPLSKLELKVEICNTGGDNCERVPLIIREFPSAKYYKNCPKCEGNVRGKFVAVDDLQNLVNANPKFRNSKSLTVRWQIHEPALESNPVAVAQVGFLTSEILKGQRLAVDFLDGTYIEKLICMDDVLTPAKNIRLPLLWLGGFIKRVNCT